MNYQAHYDRLIERARARTIGGYVERHHVVPRCMGGDNSKANIVCLTAEEHYVAHQLLVKIYPGHAGVAAAAVRLRATGTNKAYGWLRRRLADALRGNKYALGNTYTHSDEARRKMSMALRGKKFTLEHIESMSKVRMGKKLSLATREKMSRARAGKRRFPCSQETKDKISAANKGKIRTDEARAKLSASAKGRKRTPEWIANWRASMKRRKKTVTMEIV